jgi:hypothetical protein
MTVPNCDEWRAEPGFEERPCFCVAVAKRPWHDCTGCGGTGVIGTVGIGVWEEARRKTSMPVHTGDPRFDPRVICSMRRIVDDESPPSFWSRLATLFGRGK